MKKILVILMLVLLFITPCFAKTYTEEEFNEVYKALEDTTVLLEKANYTIEDLKDQVNNLTASNKRLTNSLELAQAELDNSYAVFEKTEKEINRSTKLIKTLINQKILIGAGVAAKTNFSDSFSLGYKFRLGYKVWLGYLAGDVTIFNDKTYGIGITYNFVL